MLDFSWNAIDLQKSLEQTAQKGILQFSKEQKIGFGKNDQYDYKRRLDKLSHPEEEKINENDTNNKVEEENGFDEKEEDNNKDYQEEEDDEDKYNDFDDKDKEQRDIKDRIYNDYEGEKKKYKIVIYINEKTKQDSKNEKDFYISSLFFKIQSVETNKTWSFIKEIKNIYLDPEIHISRIDEAIKNSIIDKIIEEIEGEGEGEEEGEDYNFEEVHSEKGEIRDEQNKTISAIDKNDENN